MNTSRRSPTITQSTCEAFAAAADALLLRRANRIQDRDIDDFVALGWTDWHGGSLRITPLGHMALLRIRARLAEAVA